MVTRLLLALALLAPLPAIAGTRVIDGDTIEVDGVSIRLVEIDTPETHQPRCAHERELGLAAKRRLIELLNEGELTVVVVGHDRKWNRPLAYVYAGEIDVGQVLLQEGHALHWTPGPKSKAARMAVWCPL